MVRGVDIFREFFKEFTDNYILIGGAACDEHLRGAGLNFRATKDLDIILIVEALNAGFVKRFWDFIKEGDYERKQRSEGERKYYRFLKPARDDYPYQLELFSKKPDLLNLPDEAHLTPIPTEEDLSSLSAILMNSDYYDFTIGNSKVEKNLRMAGIEALICLKAKAFLDLRARRENLSAGRQTLPAGKQALPAERQGIGGTDEKNIRKHKNDVIRLALMLTEEEGSKLPESIADDMKVFMEIIEAEPPDYKSLAKTVGLSNIGSKRIIRQIRKAFDL